MEGNINSLDEAIQQLEAENKRWQTDYSDLQGRNIYLKTQLDQYKEMAERLSETLCEMVADPHGCSFCEYGKSRLAKHDDECVYVLTKQAIAAYEKLKSEIQQ